MKLKFQRYQNWLRDPKEVKVRKKKTQQYDEVWGDLWVFTPFPMSLNLDSFKNFGVYTIKIWFYRIRDDEQLTLMERFYHVFSHITWNVSRITYWTLQKCKVWRHLLFHGQWIFVFILCCCQTMSLSIHKNILYDTFTTNLNIKQLTFKVSSKICSRQHSIFFYFMWIVCLADNSHEISRLIFYEKIIIIIKNI